LLALKPASENPYACGFCIANNGMRRLANPLHVCIGNVIHRAIIERNQVSGHFEASFLGQLWGLPRFALGGLADAQ
jgi:hypothetical protein